METLTLVLHKSKDTKNKLVDGTADGGVIESPYIDKGALGEALRPSPMSFCPLSWARKV